LRPGGRAAADRVFSLHFGETTLQWFVGRTRQETLMTYRGHVKGGVVVLDEAVKLPDGVEVRVELSPDAAGETALDESGQTLGQKLLKYAGKAVGLPPDAAMNHDHYLYGTPKK
jgi:hypothetical protein